MSADRLCWSCKHFYFDGGDPGYSEYTPGWEGYFECRKEVFKRTTLEDCGDADGLRKVIETAKTCDKFEAR